MKTNINNNFQHTERWDGAPTWDEPPEIIGKTVERAVVSDSALDMVSGGDSFDTHNDDEHGWDDSQ